jgi:hypothetical protein
VRLEAGASAAGKESKEQAKFMLWHFQMWFLAVLECDCTGVPARHVPLPACVFPDLQSMVMLI